VISRVARRCAGLRPPGRRRDDDDLVGSDAELDEVELSLGSCRYPQLADARRLVSAAHAYASSVTVAPVRLG
jgi:hypothetical protein